MKKLAPDTIYWETFISQNFRKNGNFKDFAENIFANDPHDQ